MRQHLNEGHKKLPIILNICMYNGKSSYQGSRHIYDLFSDPELAKNYMFSSYELIDLHASVEEDLKKDKRAYLGELVLKQGIYRDFMECKWLLNHLDYILNSKEKGGVNYVEDIILYILGVDKDEEIQTKLESLHPKIKALTMSVYQLAIK